MGFFFALLIFFIVAAIQIVSNVRNDRKWHVGLFELEQEEALHSADRLLEAYISLGALMTRMDTASYGKKVHFFE